MGTNNNVERASELFKAQAHIYKHAFAYANSMALNCAIQLGIPDIIHNHKKPITLPDLLSALKLPSSKSDGIHRVMRLLVHSQFIDIKKLEENSETEGYVLTTSSRLLLKSEIPNLSPCVRGIVDPVLVTPWQLLGEWFHKNEEATPFEIAHGVPMWDFCAQNPRFYRVFDEGMASDSQMMRLIVKDCKEVFEGLNSLVDVGGGTGIVAKIILETIPHLKCTVLDVPHVVANMPQSENLCYVGGDMFQSIPHADAILLKASDSKTIDTALNVLGSNNSGATFLATVSLSFSSLIGAWMANNSLFSSALIYGDTRPETLSIKFISLLIFFLMAFAFFLQSSRCFIHANYLITTPDTDIPISYVELAVIRGGEFWSLGLRALYFATTMLPWFFGPIPMFATSIGMVFFLHHLDKNTKELHDHRSSGKRKQFYKGVGETTNITTLL